MKVAVLGPQIYQNGVGATGTTRAGLGLVDSLKTAGVEADYHVVRAHEMYVFGRNVGGFVTSKLRLWKYGGDADIVHALSPNFASRKTQLVTAFDLVPRYEPGAYPEARIMLALLKHRVRRNRTHIMCSSRSVAEQIRGWTGAPREQIHVSPLGIGEAAYVQAPAWTPEDARVDEWVLSVGEWRHRKNIHALIGAVGQVRAEGRKLGVVHVGPPMTGGSEGTYADSCRGMAHKLGVPLASYGWIPDERLSGLYRGCSVLAYPSTEEGYGLPPLEAAAQGRPSIVGPCPVFKETMGADAHHMRTGSTKDCHKALLEALDGPVSQDRLVRLARSHDWQEAAKAHCEAYDAILGNGKGAGG